MRRIICALVISLACLLSATNARSDELASCPVGTIASVLGTTCRIGFAQFSFYQFNTWFYDYSGNWTSGPAASDIAFIPDGSKQNAPEITLVFNVSVTDYEYATAALYFLASTLSAPRYFSGIDIIDSELQVGPGDYAEANTFGSVRAIPALSGTAMWELIMNGIMVPWSTWERRLRVAPPAFQHPWQGACLLQCIHSGRLLR